MNSIDYITMAFLAAFGACVGSFCNVVIYRLPEGKSIVHPPSACPGCGQAIRWYDNIPILSWIILRARCRACGQPISIQYPLVELLTALLFAGWYGVAYHSGWRPGFALLGPAETWPIFLAYLVLFTGLLIATLIDARYYVIPLTVMWIIAGAGLVAHVGEALRGWTWYGPTTTPRLAIDHPWLGAALGGMAGLIVSVMLVQARLLPRSFDASPVEQQEDEAPDAFLAHPHPRREVLKECMFLALPIVGAAVVSALLDGYAMPTWLHVASGVLFGYLVGGGIVWLTRILGTLAFGKEAMGLGDVHLMAAVGAVAGWEVAAIAFFLAPFSGLLWALGSAGVSKLLNRQVRIIPYGPHLALASVAVIVAYDPVFHLLGLLTGSR